MGASCCLLLWPQKIYRPGLHFFAGIGVHEPAFWRVADGGQYRQLHQHEFYRRAGTGGTPGASVAGDITRVQRGELCRRRSLTPIITRVLFPAFRQKSRRY